MGEVVISSAMLIVIMVIVAAIGLILIFMNGDAIADSIARVVGFFNIFGGA